MLKANRVLMAAMVAVASIAYAEKETPMKPIKEIFEPSGSFPASQYMKVAVIQWAGPVAPLTKSAKEAEEFKQSNRESLAELIEEAAGKGAKLIITSEMGVIGYPDIPELPEEDDNFRTREEIMPYVEKVPGPSTEYFGKLAKKLGVFIQFGTAEKDGQDLYNVAVAMDPSGKMVAKHRKVSLYHQEQDYFTPGSKGGVYETPAGKIGMMICADVYTESVLGQYRGKVAALALSTSWAQMNTGWENFVSAARSTKAYMLAANQPYFPDSGVAEPSGKVQSHIRQTTRGTAYGYLPLEKKK